MGSAGGGSSGAAIGGSIAAVLIVGLQKFRRLSQLNKSQSEIEQSVDKAMEDYAPHVVESLEKRMNLLTMIATVSPLLGMTGTVVGMIKVFAQLQLEGAGNAAALAGGISEALITTAAGLTVAIPALIFHRYFLRRVDEIVVDMEQDSLRLVEIVHGEREATNSGEKIS